MPGAVAVGMRVPVAMAVAMGIGGAVCMHVFVLNHDAKLTVGLRNPVANMPEPKERHRR